MSKYVVLKKDAQTAAQAGTPMIGLKISTLLALIEERDELLKALKDLAYMNCAGHLIQAADAIRKAEAE